MDQREGAFARGADNMKERPILFSAPMVRALLDGRKTQTRRAVKISHRTPGLAACLMPTDPARVRPDLAAELCPYGHPGDRLWVRESGWERSERTAKMMREGADTWPRFAYAADDWSDQDRADFKAWGFKARPSIHMPRWASRITLEITGVRVERLQEIIDADAEAEGIERTVCGDGWRRYADQASELVGIPPCETPRESYRSLWESINGLSSWHPNPWVWVVEFRRVTA